MTDSNRTSASTGLPTLVDDGTPAGNPTPAGEPTADRPAELLLTDQLDALPSSARLLESVGGLVLAWGALEHTTAEKLAAMRQSFGDVRAVGGRTRPTMPKLLAELRALVAMRDRHDKQVLTLIAEMDGALQRIAQFRLLVTEGAQHAVDDTLICRDLKNNAVHIPREDIRRESGKIDRIKAQIAGL